MKSFFATALVIIGLLIFSYSRQAMAEVNPVDCTANCLIATCKGGDCQVWSCDARACAVAGRFVVKSRAEGSAPIFSTTRVEGYLPAFDRVCDSGDRRPCAIRGCKSSTCTLSIFDGKRFVRVAQMDESSYYRERSFRN
ncbi:hypothetical protein [Arenimonas oryziterrae]|uniref:hypothetical protein n=1 Tax=Arenimonas oryziterrae TaxID=498055 RepID=UPI0012DF16C3|nr:hypothetical protein [Arenimonas oryziterrae]